jgi:prevent-host-death family protein
MARRTSIADARADFSALVNRVAHGKERIILTSRSRPKAALAGMDDLRAIEDLPSEGASDAALAEADALVERILARRGGKLVSDSADDLAAIREGER